MSIVETLFEILDGEAEDSYFIWREETNNWAEKPAIIICSGPFAKLGLHSYTVYFGHGMADWTFKTHHESQEKVLEVLQTAKIQKPFKVKHLNRKGKEDILTVGSENSEGLK